MYIQVCFATNFICAFFGIIKYQFIAPDKGEIAETCIEFYEIYILLRNYYLLRKICIDLIIRESIHFVLKTLSRALCNHVNIFFR